ncbi:MAG: sensor histidine kinase [Acidimicrobiia bacterium]
MGPRSRSAVVLSALGIGLFQVVGSFGAAGNQPDRKAIDALALALILAGPAALAVRDRWPLVSVAVALATANLFIALGYPYGPIFVSVVVALFSAVQAGHRRPTWVLAGLGFAGHVVAGIVDPRAGPLEPVWVHVALVAGWVTVVLAVAEVVRTRRERATEAAQALEEEERRRAGEQRLRMAQELHDVLAHNISLINVQAGVALHLIDEQPEQARSALANIKEASRDALHELRTTLDLLRHGPNSEAPRSPAPRLADLDALVEGVRAGGLDVSVERDGTPGLLPSAVELAAYRIVQEALTNVTRHARARTVTVRLRYGDGVTVEVVDDGVGAPPGLDNLTAGPPGAGNGIAGMRERAAALGGSVEAGSVPGGGFRVLARLPDGTGVTTP